MMTLNHWLSTREAELTATPVASITGLNTNVDNEVIYLDRHDVVCGEGSVLKSWRLQHECTAAETGTCVTRSTTANDQGAVNFLDRHHFDCNEGLSEDEWLLRDWKLNNLGRLNCPSST